MGSSQIPSTLRKDGINHGWPCRATDLKHRSDHVSTPTPPTLSLLTLRVPKPSCRVQISPDVGSSRLSPGVFPLPVIHFLLLGDLTQYQGFKYHPYADNSQIYLPTLDLFPELQTHISNCLLDIALECLIDISNVTCQKWSSWSAPLDSCCISFLTADFQVLGSQLKVLLDSSLTLHPRH